jgi:hypothetical protein
MAQAPRKRGGQRTVQGPGGTAGETVHEEPLVLSRGDVDLTKKKGRKSAKRGSSANTRRLEDIERRVSKAGRRVARSLYHGVDEYVDARDKSARRRRDGALVDMYENVSRGVSKAVSEASPALVDVAKAFNTRKSRRSIRRTLKRLPRIPVIG